MSRTTSPHRRQPDGASGTPPQPILAGPHVLIAVSEEGDGWYVRHGDRFGPFYAKKTAMDLAADIVAILRASGTSAGVQMTSPPRPD